MRHHTDDDCRPHLGPDDGSVQECPICGVLHGDPCDHCGGRGYHNAGCPDSEETAIETDARAWLRELSERRQEHVLRVFVAHRAIFGLMTAIYRAGLYAPWHCPAEYTDVVETAHARAVRRRAVAIFRAEYLPTFSLLSTRRLGGS